VVLGEVDVMENITITQKAQLKAGLISSGFELMDVKKSILIERLQI
jgi:hypothetical protein